MENQHQEELSPEQLKERRAEMQKFYEDSVPYLEAQAKYEKLLTDVEEARYKRATMQLQYANMMAASHHLEEEEEELPQQRPVTPVAKAPAPGKKLRKG
jgi:hypothetical protein